MLANLKAPERREVFSLSLKPSTVARIDALAKQHNTSRSNVVEQILDQAGMVPVVEVWRDAEKAETALRARLGRKKSACRRLISPDDARALLLERGLDDDISDLVKVLK